MTKTRTSYPIFGSNRSIEVFTLRGKQDGPVLAVTGAVHGDELEGPLALSSLLASLGEGDELRGTLIVVPVSNPEATAAAVRCTPADGANLARTFPGKPDGTITESIAALLTEHVINKATHLIDLHSAAVASACPFFSGYTSDTTAAPAREMAIAFGAPVVWRHEPPAPPGRTLSVAAARGIPSIYVEATGGLFPPQEIVEGYLVGVRRVMALIGMIAPMQPLTDTPVFLRGDGNTDSPSCQSPATGLIECHISPLQEVAADTLCYTLRDLDGRVLEEIRPGIAGITTFVRRSRWVEAGQLLVSIASSDHLERAPASR